MVHTCVHVAKQDNRLAVAEILSHVIVIASIYYSLTVSPSRLCSTIVACVPPCYVLSATTQPDII